MSLKTNLVGHPHFYRDLSGASAGVTWSVTVPGGSSNQQCNVVNATPVQDFGVTHLSHLANVNALRPFMIAMVQQFTVTKPMNGNAVLVELSGGFSMSAPRSALVVPIFGRIASAVSSSMEARSINGGWRYIGPPDRPSVDPGSDLLSTRCVVYKEHVVISADDPSGVYVHGFGIREEGGSTNVAIGKIYGDFGLRTLDAVRAGYNDYNPAV